MQQVGTAAATAIKTDRVMPSAGPRRARFIRGTTRSYYQQVVPRERPHRESARETGAHAFPAENLLRASRQPGTARSRFGLALGLNSDYFRARGDPMRSLRIAEDIVPVSDFKAQASEWLRRVAESGHPLVITQNGKAAGVLLSPQAFDELTERSRFLASVDEGLADSDAGRVHAHDKVVAEMNKRFRKPAAK